MSDRAQAETLGCDVLLPSDIGSADDQPQFVQRGIGEMEVFEDRFEATPWPAVVELHGRNLWGIEGSCILRAGLLLQFSFFDEPKFRLGIDEPLDQPRAGNPLYLYVLARNPSHDHLAAVTDFSYQGEMLR
jgi:hypothetical protein